MALPDALFYMLVVRILIDLAVMKGSAGLTACRQGIHAFG